MITGDIDIMWSDNLQGSMGSAHSISSEAPERDRVEELRKTVEEITRKPVNRETRRMGFL